MLPTVFQYLPVAVVMFFATKLGNKFGRREVCSLGVLIAAAFYLILFVLALFRVVNVWLYLLANLMAGIGTAFLFLLVWVLLRFVYPLSKKRVAELQVQKNRLFGKE